VSQRETTLENRVARAATAALERQEYVTAIDVPAGVAATTRAARRASPRNLVVVRWSRTHKRYQRIGLLVEPAALTPAVEPAGKIS
jgi:hypothetical protein